MARSLACVLTLASLGLAQTRLVLPSSFASAEATGSTNVPFGRSTPMLVQTAYEASLVPHAVTIQALALRLDGGLTSAGKTVEMELRASSMSRSIIFIQADFAQNRGADEKIVITRKLVSLPALASGSTPSPFHASLAFDQGFVFTPGANALVIETVVFGQPPGVLSLDATYLCDSPNVAFGPPGCGPQGGSVLKAECETLQVMWGRPFTIAVKNARPLAPALLMLGSMESGSWLGFPIPFALGVVGAPGCSLSVDPLLLLSATADGAGVASYPFSVPSMPSLKGEWLRFQGAALDAAANALGLVSSQGSKVQVCGWEPVARVYATSASATSGVREIGIAPVVELAVQ